MYFNTKYQGKMYTSRRLWFGVEFFWFKAFFKPRFTLKQKLWGEKKLVLLLFGFWICKINRAAESQYPARWSDLRLQVKQFPDCHLKAKCPLIWNNDISKCPYHSIRRVSSNQEAALIHILLHSEWWKRVFATRHSSTGWAIWFLNAFSCYHFSPFLHLRTLFHDTQVVWLMESINSIGGDFSVSMMI